MPKAAPDIQGARFNVYSTHRRGASIRPYGRMPLADSATREDLLVTNASNGVSNRDREPFPSPQAYARFVRHWIDRAVSTDDGPGSWTRWLKALLLVAVITFAGGLLDLRVAPTNLAMLYLMGVVFISYNWGLGPALIASIVSAFTFDFVFIPPYMSFAVTDAWYLVNTLTLMCLAVLISVLSTAVREHALAASRREAQTAALYEMTKSLANARHTQEVLTRSAARIHSTFGLTIAVLLPTTGGELELRRSGVKLENAVRTAAEEHFRSAARGETGTRDGAYLPLVTAQRTIGVMLLTLDGSAPNVGARDEIVLQAMAGQVALAIERAELEEQAREAEVLRKADEFQRNLLNSISHSLRAPLAAIVSAVNPIVEGQGGEQAAVVELARIAHEEACRLDRLIGNLLEMSRLEAGALKLRLEPHDIKDVIGTALREFRNPLDREIRFAIRDRLPLAVLDFSLIVHTLVNLLDNAAKYSPAGSPLEVGAGRVGEEIHVCVADRGFGIPIVERAAVFGRFARGSATEATPGLGLGLPICKAFVEAHKGRIWIEDRPGGGTIFHFSLPISGASSQSSPPGGVQRPVLRAGSSS